MNEYVIAYFFFLLFVILISSYAISRVFDKYKLPIALAPLLIGFFLSFWKEQIFLFKEVEIAFNVLSNLAVIFLLFLAGLEVNLKEMLQTSKFGFSVFISSMIFPILFTLLLCLVFGFPFWLSLIVALALSVTAEGILVELLEERGLIDKHIGAVTLEVATLDDIFEILAFVYLSSLIAHAFTLNQILIIFVQMALFVLMVLIIRFVMISGISYFLGSIARAEQLVSVALAILFFLAALAQFSHLGILIGALIAGILVRTALEKYGKKGVEEEKTLEEVIKEITLGFLAPIFLFTIGINIKFESFSDLKLLIFTFFLILIPFFSKVLGTYLPYKLARKNTKEGIILGIGLNVKGGIDLIIAAIGLSTEILTKEIFSCIIISSFVLSIISMILFGKFMKQC